MEHRSKVRTCLWFEKGGRAAAEWYVTLLPGSEIQAVHEHGRPDDPMVVEFTLAGAPMMVLTVGGGPAPSEAASISVLTEDQRETDRLWSALTGDGGEEGPCGWAKDRFGVSWQVMPKRLPELLALPDREAADRAMRAMMEMKRIDSPPSKRRRASGVDAMTRTIRPRCTCGRVVLDDANDMRVESGSLRRQSVKPEIATWQFFGGVRVRHRGRRVAADRCPPHGGAGGSANPRPGCGLQTVEGATWTIRCARSRSPNPAGPTSCV